MTNNLKEIESVLKKARNRIDDIPDAKKDITARIEYLQQIVQFDKRVFRGQLAHMINGIQEELSDISNTRELDMMYKGSINVLALLLKWSDDAEAELVSIMRELKGDTIE